MDAPVSYSFTTSGAREWDFETGISLQQRQAAIQTPTKRPVFSIEHPQRVPGIQVCAMPKFQKCESVHLKRKHVDGKTSARHMLEIHGKQWCSRMANKNWALLAQKKSAVRAGQSGLHETEAR